ncbi:hypothetical protein [uncultured Dokdonia sp.]|uniref:hypothetical protein n=1 Tax=uncultured Dokdonia sp. TaxID=575653 RepID=UPI00261272C9|nr:hypothetical protein [uncultured Dokdonia sp.]
MKSLKTLAHMCFFGYILVLLSEYITQHLLYTLGSTDNYEFFRLASLDHLQSVILFTISSFLFYFIRHNLLYKAHTPNKLLVSI